MARVELQDSWEVDGDLMSVEQTLFAFFKQHKMKVTKHEPGRIIEVGQGSQWQTRLIGGFFVRPTTLPKKANFCLLDTSQSVQLDVTIEECLGLGSIMGMKQKYEDYFITWMMALKQEFGLFEE